jgi:hypothetical protein
VKSAISNAQAAATKQSAEETKPEAEGEEVVIGPEVVERLKSWCYV